MSEMCQWVGDTIDNNCDEDCPDFNGCPYAPILKLLAEAKEVTEDEKYVIRTNLAKDIDGSPWQKVTFWIRR